MSASVNFNTADRIIRMAMQNAKLLQKGENPDPEDYADMMNRLNDIINLEQTQGLKLWLNSAINLPLLNGVGKYVLGLGSTLPRALRILEAYFVYPSGSSYPLNPVSWNEYGLLSGKGQPGSPNSFFVDKGQDNLSVILWPVPDLQAALGTLQLVQQAAVTNLIKINDTMNFPPEWFIFLHWALADDISSGQSEAIMARCTNKANAYRQALQDWDVEDASTSFSPSYQGR